MDEDGGDSAEEDNDERRRERWRWRRRRKGESEFDFEAKVNFETILKFPLNCNYFFDQRWRFERSVCVLIYSRELDFVKLY